MNRPTNRPWWAVLGFGPARSAPDTDYADMGTAFGLDASMSKPPEEAQRAEPASPAGPARPPQGGRPR